MPFPQKLGFLVIGITILAMSWLSHTLAIVLALGLMAITYFMAIIIIAAVKQVSNLETEIRQTKIELEEQAARQQTRKPSGNQAGAGNTSRPRPRSTTPWDGEVDTILQQARSVEGFATTTHTGQERALRKYAEQLQNRQTPVETLVDEAMRALHPNQAEAGAL